jgi:hypothetical protein
MPQLETEWSMEIDERNLLLAELDALLEDVAARAQATRPHTAEGLTFPQTLALALFVATFEVFLGMRALLRERLAEEARMLSRTLLDDSTRLIWLATVRADADELEARAARFVFESLEYEGPLMRAAAENGYDWAEEALADIDKELAEVRTEAKRRGITLKRMPKPIDLMTALKQRRLYYWHVRASQSIHSSRIGVSSRFRPGRGENETIAIQLESPIDEVVQVGAMAVQVFTLALIAAVDLLLWDGRDELVDYLENVKERAGGLFERAKEAAKA